MGIAASCSDKYVHVSHDRELKHKASLNSEPQSNANEQATNNKIKTAAMAIIAVQPERSSTAIWLDEQDEKKRLAEQAEQRKEREQADIIDEMNKSADVLKEMLKKYTSRNDVSRLPLGTIKKLVEKEIPADYEKIVRLYQLDSYNPEDKFLGNYELIEKVEKAIENYLQKLLKVYNDNPGIKRSGKVLTTDFAKPLAPAQMDVDKIKTEALELVKKFSPRQLEYPKMEYGAEYEELCNKFENEEILAWIRLKKMGIETSRNRALRQFILKQKALMQDIYQQNRLCYFHKRLQALEEYYEDWLKNVVQDDSLPRLTEDDARYYFKIKKELGEMLTFDSNLCSRGSIEKLETHVREVLAKIKSCFDKIVDANNARYDAAILVQSITQDPSLENYLKLKEAFEKSLNLAKSIKNKKIIEKVNHDIELVQKRIKQLEETQQKDPKIDQTTIAMPAINNFVAAPLVSKEPQNATVTLPLVQNSNATVSKPSTIKTTHLDVPGSKNKKSPASKTRALPPIAKKNKPKTLSIKPRSKK